MAIHCRDLRYISNQLKGARLGADVFIARETG